MKKFLAGLIATAFIFPAFPLMAEAACSPVALGGTGWCNIVSNSILMGNGTGRLATTSAGSNGQILFLLNGLPQWASASSSIATPISIANGGTATSTGGYTNGVEFYNGSTLTNNNLLQFNGTNLSLGATTTFGTLLNLNGVANFSTATSSFYSSGGINLAAGCFSIAGSCISQTIQNATAFKAAVTYAATSSLPSNTYLAGVLTAVGTGALYVDGANPSIGQRILVKNESTQTNNGIYVVTATGSGIASYVLTRSSDFNTSADIYPGVSTYVLSGTANGDTIWTLTTPAPVTLDSSNLTFVESANGNITLPISISNGGTATSTGGYTNGIEAYNGSTLTNFNGYSLTSSLLSATNASTTNLTAGTSLGIPTGSNPSPISAGFLTMSTNAPYQIHLGNSAAGTTIFDPRLVFVLTVSSTTLLSGTTTSPAFVLPKGIAVTAWMCTMQPSGATAEIAWQYANPSAYATVAPTYMAASTTPGIVAIASNNTPTLQATSTLSVGAPSGNAQSASCSFYGNAAAI